MGGATAIGDVGQTLIDLLEEHVGIVGRGDVALASPAAQGEQGNDWRLTLYLYDVSKNAHLEDVERPPPPPDDGPAREEPLVLDLQYLLTAYPASSAADTGETAEQHRVLGEAMQAFRDHALVGGSRLRGSLEGDADLQVSIRRESIDAVMNVWNTFPDQAYRPSVAYLVTPVTVESAHEREVERVVQRDLEERELAPEGEGRE